MNHLYKVTITRFVVAPDEHAAQTLAIANNNQLDIDAVEKPETLSDIPSDWRTCQPYGALGNLNVEQYFINQLAATPEYSEFYVQPIRIMNGNVEPAEPGDPLAEFGLYARYRTGMSIHLADFPFIFQAEGFMRRIERARQVKSMSLIPEDAHLEALYEDQVCGMVEA